MKRLLRTIVMLICVSLFLCGYSGKETYLVDEADIFGDKQTELEDQARELSSKLNAQIVIITLDTEQDGQEYDDIERFGEEFYQEHGFGEEQGGVMLLIDMGQRKYTVVYTGGLLNHSLNREIADEVAVVLKQNDYVGAAKKYLECVEKYVTDYENSKSDSNNVENNLQYGNEHEYNVEREETNPVKEILIRFLAAMVIAGIIVVILIVTRNHDAKPSGNVYIGEKGVNILSRKDRFTHTTVVTRKIERESDHSDSSSSESSGGSEDSGSAGGSF